MTKEEHKSMLNSIISKVPILKTEQLVLCSLKCDSEIDKTIVESLLLEMQNEGSLLLSPSGWCVTQNTYRNLTNDKYRKGIHQTRKYESVQEAIDGKKYINSLDFHYYLDEKLDVYSQDGNNKIATVNFEELMSDFQKDLVDCMWLIADLMPLSKSFIVSSSIWPISFCADNSKESRLFRLIKIPKKSEDIKIEMIKSTPIIESKDFQKSIYSICLMESSDHAWKIPYLGVNVIAAIDNTKPKHFKIIEKRKLDEAWKDVN